MIYENKETKEIIACKCGNDELIFEGSSFCVITEGHSYKFRCLNPKCRNKFEINEDFKEL